MAAAAVPRRLRIATSLSRERLARRAGALLAAVTITVSSTVAFIAAFAWFVARHPNDSRWAEFTTASTAVVAATVFVLSGALILWWAGSGLRSVISRRRSAGVTVASPHIVEVVAQLALAAGITGPSVVACDDPAPNTTVTVRRGAAPSSAVPPSHSRSRRTRWRTATRWR